MDRDYEDIAVERDGGVTFLCFNRPSKRNAMSPQLHYEMDDALGWLAHDEETKVLILTGKGESFSAGQDLKLYFRQNFDNPVERARSQAAANTWRWHKISNFPKPTIAMVNGYCFGGAFTPVCACDIAIAADDATFGLSEVNWGVIPGGIVSWNIAQMLSHRDAMFYAMTGLPFDGKKAAEIKLVNYSVPKDELRSETLRIANILLEKNPATLRYTKEAVRHVRGMEHDQAYNFLAAKLQALQHVDKEKGMEKGLSSFLDEKKHKPGFGTFER